MRILVTGGAGFVGGWVATELARRRQDAEVTAADNLHRRGSELNLPRLAAAGVHFVHMDVRSWADVSAIGSVDLIVECSADPSAVSGLQGGEDFLYETNLAGAFNCLKLARARSAALLFVSTSRVYPVAALRSLALVEEATRFSIRDDETGPGVTSFGISEDFPLSGARTLYGATKLAAELLIGEYVEAFGLKACVLRCGAIAGPWQMGRVDQGVAAYWLLAHRFGVPLRYLGYGGTGKQVRDLLHVEDLVDLIDLEIQQIESWTGVPQNVGGGLPGSVSLFELTRLCEAVVGRATTVDGAADEPRPGDVPFFITDHRRITERTGWTPTRRPEQILEDIWEWAAPREDRLRAVLFE